MVFRAFFIVINTFLITYTFLITHLVITPIVLFTVLIMQIYDIFRKEKSDRGKFLSYLESAILEETTSRTASKKQSVYTQIDNAVKQINDRFIQSNIENQEKANLLNALLSHINIGLITFNSCGDIDVLNKSARNLLSISYLSNIRETNLFKTEDIQSLLDFNIKIKQTFELTDKRFVYIESSDFTLHEIQIRIISIQNIKKALDTQEMNSWNTLIRTLNHEIMNSITPISSLASSALSLLENEQNHDLVEAVETIERRSKNLLKFVENYKNYSQIPEPQKELIQVRELINRIDIFMSSHLIDSGAKLTSCVDDEELMVYADSAQLEQILINLIKNSVEASSTEIIIVSKMNTASLLTITVTDNGTGFSAETESNAFIPFYSTKSDGSGLGLSIVRQIMHLHQGSVGIQSGKNGSSINLEFS